jgi:hypothetical protein
MARISLAQFLRHAPDGAGVRLIADYQGNPGAPDPGAVLGDQVLRLYGELSEDWMIWTWNQQDYPSLERLYAEYEWEEEGDEPDNFTAYVHKDHVGESR